MVQVLFVHHTVSPPLDELFSIASQGCRQAATELAIDLTLSTRPALTASASDVLAADGILLGSPVNIGYMSGALKHFFDQIYYPCLHESIGLPVGYYLHGNNDTVGATKAIDSIIGAMRWTPVGPPVTVTSGIGSDERDSLLDLACRLVVSAAER
mgnify:FL=1